MTALIYETLFLQLRVRHACRTRYHQRYDVQESNLHFQKVKASLITTTFVEIPIFRNNMHMLSGCELIDTENAWLPEYEVCWWVSEANESQTSYSVEQADIFQYQPYSHSDDRLIILKSSINTNASIGFDICIFSGKIIWFKIFKIRFPKMFAHIPFIFTCLYKC
jgi:hypothetical protein